LKPQAETYISRAETQWLGSLESNARSYFSGIFLPSHDHTHHRRVWNLCKRLIRETGATDSGPGYDLVEGLMVAAWFHDLGMARTTSEKHGAAGSDICREFFQNCRGPLPVLLPEVLEAIELHDSKEESIYAGGDSEGSHPILTLLSVADDLEALGTIGIYRYTEIYLERGIPLPDLCSRVVENVTRRFRNLSSCKGCSGVIRSFEGEWKELVTFFKQCQRQAEVCQYPDQERSGPLGVIRHIRTAGMKGKVRPEWLMEALVNVEPGAGRQEDPYVIHYFKRLKDELEQARC
jgi:hypothetical protein